MIFGENGSYTLFNAIGLLMFLIVPRLSLKSELVPNDLLEICLILLVLIEGDVVCYGIFAAFGMSLTLSNNCLIFYELSCILTTLALLGVMGQNSFML